MNDETINALREFEIVAIELYRDASSEHPIAVYHYPGATMQGPINPTSELAPVIGRFFKFAIGDFVAIATVAQTAMESHELNQSYIERYPIRVTPPHCFQIVLRRIDECHGGIQIMYGLSGYQDNTGGPSIVWRYEYELLTRDEALTPFRVLAPAPEPEPTQV